MPTSSDDHMWYTLYPILRSYAWHLVTRTNLQNWIGQEYDLVEDIVQESIYRAYLYMQQTENSAGKQIVSLNSFSRWVAHNFCEDLRRKEGRLYHPSIHENVELADITATHGNWADPIEEALEKIALLSFFFELAPIIKTFPPKQRIALLIDLANLSDFEEQPSLLESALLEVDISLKDYVQLLPLDPRLRSQHCSLLSIAYRRLKEQAKDIDFVA